MLTLTVCDISGLLYDRTYEIGTSTCFIVKYPKYREVFAASFRDRIIHHWICLRLNPLFEYQHRLLGDVSHNCRVGFGSKYSVKEVAQAMKRISDKYDLANLQNHFC